MRLMFIKKISFRVVIFFSIRKSFSQSKSSTQPSGTSPHQNTANPKKSNSTTSADWGKGFGKWVGQATCTYEQPCLGMTNSPMYFREINSFFL